MANENSDSRRRLVIAGGVALAAVAVVAAVILRDGATDEPVTASPTEDAVGSPATSPTPSEPSPTQDSAATEVEPFEGELWFVSGERLSFGTTILPRTQRPGEVSSRLPTGSSDQRVAMVLEALLEGPAGPDVEAGADTAIPAGTRLLGVEMGHESPVVVDLSREFESGGGSLSMQLRVAQVVFTATQLDGVDEILITIEGEAVDSIGGEGVLVDRPLGRTDFLDHAPAIVLVGPKIGSSVSSPVRIAGHANVFEANVSIRVLDAGGDPLAETFTTATCGSGCWGKFAEQVSFTIQEEQMGRIVVLTYSAEDGSPQDQITIPVTLAP